MIIHVFPEGEKVNLSGFAIAYHYTVEGEGYFRGAILTGPYSIQANDIEDAGLKAKLVRIIVEDIKRREDDFE